MKKTKKSQADDAYLREKLEELKNLRPSEADYIFSDGKLVQVEKSVDHLTSEHFSKIASLQSQLEHLKSCETCRLVLEMEQKI